MDYLTDRSFRHELSNDSLLTSDVCRLKLNLILKFLVMKLPETYEHMCLTWKCKDLNMNRVCSH